MARNFRKPAVVSGDHLNSSESGPPWVVLWETVARDDGRWSEARAPTEAGAFDQAEHLVKLGFVVHAIKNPTGIVVMDTEAVYRRFNRQPQASPPDKHDQEPDFEQLARGILRAFVQELHALPGRMLAISALYALFSPAGVKPNDFEHALSLAKGHGWLNVADGVLTLTHSGYATIAA